MVLVDRAGLPLGVHLSSASPAESTLADATLDAVAVPRGGGRRPGRPRKKPERIIADRGYDCRALWERWQKKGIRLIVPHRRGRRPENQWQDGRTLRRYRRRWIVERTNAWLLSFRRLTVRWEHKLEIYRAFVHLACALIVLRRF